MTIEVRLLTDRDLSLLEQSAADIFDDPLAPARALEFLLDRRHCIAAAIENGAVAAMATGVMYLHPDKTVPELWINEVGVAPARRGRGHGKAVVRALLNWARDAGCESAWVLTNSSNEPARRLYASCGGVEATEDTVMYEFQLGDDRRSETSLSGESLARDASESPADQRRCDECGSDFVPAASKMAGLCAECAHRLYGYPPCAHDMKDGRCATCGWDGSVSDFLKS